MFTNRHIILLHGAIGAKDQLQLLAEELKNDFTVHTMNFSGHGGEPFPAYNFSIEMFATDVLNYIEEKNLQQPAIFGYSMGGYAGMYIANNFPGKISKLITLATKFYWDEKVAEKENAMLSSETIEQQLPAFAKELEKRHSPNDWKELLNRTKQLLTDLGTNNTLKPEDYSSINTPCLLLLGDRDKMITLEETVAVYKQIPNASFGVLPKTPHPLGKVDVSLLSFFIRRFID